MAKQSISTYLGSGFLHGADYNPDQWGMDEAILNEDFQLMKMTGCTSMSVGIFSWTQYEPEEDVYCFEWMDRLMDRMHAEGMKAFLATPSGSKPMWMQHKYPEIRRVTADGRREPPGFRHNHCPSSELYRDKARTLNEQLAKRYSKYPALALWHVGNELQGECFCDTCLNRFRRWLLDRYQTLDAVNEAWWSGFWNHTITDWDQIDPRDPSVDGMLLDWKRFVNILHVEFLENEMAPLREHSPNIPCTTNYMIADAPLLNYGEWSKVIDIISNDAYPNYFGVDAAGSDEGMISRAVQFGFIHDLTRGMNDGKPWMLLECSPSMVNWTRVNKLKPDGVHLLEIKQALAHGADTIHYFQWRKGRGGFEKFHGAVIDHDPRTDTRVFQEVAKTGRFLKAHSHLATSTITDNPAVILYDWESRWAMSTSCGIREPSQKEHDIVVTDAYHKLIHDHYRGAWSAGLGIDAAIVDPEGLPNLSGYSLIMAPATYLLRENAAEALLDLVKQGATLVLSHHSAVVDANNRVHRDGLPGLGLHEAAGVKVEAIDSLYDDEVIAVEMNGEDRTPDANAYTIHESYGLLHLQGAEVVASYKNSPWAGTPAVTRNSHGKGEIWLFSGHACSGLYAYLYKTIAQSRSIKRVLDTELPYGVYASKRVDENGNAHIFVMNLTSREQQVKLPDQNGYTVYGTDNPVTSLTLPAYDVATVTLT